MGVYPLFFKDFVFYPVFLSPWVSLEGILSAVHGRALLGGEGALPGAAVEAEGLKTDVPDSALPGWGGEGRRVFIGSYGGSSFHKYG